MVLLKKVSRSFYLSLRLLPRAMREDAALGYLLARASDSIADSSAAPSGIRVSALDACAHALKHPEEQVVDATVLASGLADPAEAELLRMFPELLHQLRALPAARCQLLQQLMETILSGQRMDLVMFAGATAEQPVVYGDAEAVDDYTYRVAGCVGEFWTRLALERMGADSMSVGAAQQLRRAAAYGRGLQWVNILRDLSADLAQGRCYLPVADPHDRDALLAEHRRQCQRALGLVDEGLLYCAALRVRCLRTASVLPALLAIETLERLLEADWEGLTRRVKVGRPTVYRLLAEAAVY